MQTIKERQQLRVVIGSKYIGPDFQRPALRQLPRSWVLEESKPKPKDITPEGWVFIAMLLGWAFVFVQVALEWGAK